MSNRARKLFAPARLTKWAVSGPPFAFLLLFFVLPGVIMVIASFRYPGEFGGLAPLAAADPNTLHGFTLETYRFFSATSFTRKFSPSRFWWRWPPL